MSVGDSGLFIETLSVGVMSDPIQIGSIYKSGINDDEEVSSYYMVLEEHPYNEVYELFDIKHGRVVYRLSYVIEQCYELIS